MNKIVDNASIELVELFNWIVSYGIADFCKMLLIKLISTHLSALSGENAILCKLYARIKDLINRPLSYLNKHHHKLENFLLVNIFFH